jgi:glycosyltransferase involved in cell wall biosynthesis
MAAAIADHMANAPECDHHLLVSRDTTCQVGEHFEGFATTVTELPDARLSQVRRVRQATRSLRPHIVHAHSSYAGAYVRLALGREWQPRIVYTPHCFAFERTDVSRTLRSAFWLVEAGLSFRGGQVAACSPLEAALAGSLPGRHAVTYVPNIGRTPEGTWEPPPVGAVQVSAAGRITAQKAPALFAEAARRSDRAGQPVRWQWIGGGNADQEDLLRAAGVEVTGWLPRDEAMRRLAASHLYVHTAAWEGAPLTILEAAAAGVPVLARRTRAMEALEVEPLFESAAELADLVGAFPDGPALTVARHAGDRLRLRHTVEAQREALAVVYGLTRSAVALPA